MDVDRRRFLRQAGISAILLGFPMLRRSQGRPEEASSKALQQALRRMRERRAWGVAILIPAEAGDREVLGMSLEALFRAADGGDYDAREILVEAVFACVPRGSVDAREGEDAVLLDSEGRRVDGSALDLRFLGAGMRRLLRARGRLEARAEAVLDSEVEAALRAVVSEDGEDRDRAIALLEGSFDRLAPAIVAARIRAELSGAPSPLRSVVERRFLRLAAGAEVEALPHGVEWSERDLSDPCPACGRGFVSPRSRKFLRFLTE